ncbi:C(5)-methyltransferase homolog [Seminavis robusta]|uniref:C(5)-methyltransferase homolog n=1 Tax=Seminavis robusta TaxID=568900 RepID=A0A9N8EZB8_9STRA|nr:C(5)-methyltransferase homolog [Seminavis robusta]|eukprot:Sro3082_g343370.1 C(5))-methyltransferase homolog (860) ;mRNA; f:3036-5836
MSEKEQDVAMAGTEESSAEAKTVKKVEDHPPAVADASTSTQDKEAEVKKEEVKKEEGDAAKADDDKEKSKDEKESVVEAKDDKEDTNKNNTNNSKESWDHSNRKVMVLNCLKFLDKRRLTKMVNSWVAGCKGQVEVKKTKKPPTDSWVVVTLGHESQVPILINYIHDNQCTNKKGDRLRAIPANQVDAASEQKINQMENGNERPNKRRHDDNNTADDSLSKRQRGMQQRRAPEPEPHVITEEEIKNAMIPLWRNTYPEQIDHKQKDMIKKCAMKVVKEIKSKFRDLQKEAKRNKHRKPVKPYAWLNGIRPIVMEDVIPARSMVRNKCEFTFGYRYVQAETKDSIGTPASTNNNDKVKETTTTEATDQDVEMKKEETTQDSSGTTEKQSQPANEEATKQEESTAETSSNSDAKTDGAPEAKAEETNTAETPADASNTQKDTTNNNDNDETKIPLKKIPSVGAMARGWSGGVSHPKCCPNIPSEACAVIDIVEEFLQTCPMPPYNAKTHTGFWRTLTVRSSRRTNQCMLIFMHAPLSGGAGSKDSSDVDNYEPEVFEKEKERLMGMITDKDLPVTIPPSTWLQTEEDAAKNTPTTIRVTSIFFQEFGGISMPTPEHPVQHAYGDKFLQEKLGKCTFQISPGAFFQVNTETAELLYQIAADKVKEVATDKPEGTLCFDVCCGTGTIGLTLMKEGVVGKVVGVDISAPAIDDAKANATLNGFGPSSDDNKEQNETTRWVAARAEHVMNAELKRAREAGNFEKVVAIVDPARDGLHFDVLKHIRGFSQIDRIVYVSCNPTGSLTKDAAALCTPASKRYRGRPFKPTFAQPVDMFPYSHHCELVMVFDRLSDDELGEDELKREDR